MEKLFAAFAWPTVFLIIALVIIFTFRKQLGALISRTKSVGKSGLETFETQPAQPREEKKGVEQFFREFDNPLLLEAEELIRKDLRDRKIETPEDREKAIIRALASTNLILHFERVYGIIWASQVSLLRFLNARTEGAHTSELTNFYDTAKAFYPAWYENYAFENWIGFLESFNLILRQDSRFLITIAGREFLKYLVGMGKPGPFYG